MRFYTSVNNTRGTVHGHGAHKNQTAHIRGWSLGVRVEARADGENDCFDVFATPGSNGGQREVYLGTVRWKSGKMIFVKEQTK